MYLKIFVFCMCSQLNCEVTYVSYERTVELQDHNDFKTLHFGPKDLLEFVWHCTLIPEIDR